MPYFNSKDKHNHHANGLQQMQIASQKAQDTMFMLSEYFDLPEDCEPLLQFLTGLVTKKDYYTAITAIEALYLVCCEDLPSETEDFLCRVVDVSEGVGICTLQPDEQFIISFTFFLNEFFENSARDENDSEYGDIVNDYLCDSCREPPHGETGTIYDMSDVFKKMQSEHYNSCRHSCTERDTAIHPQNAEVILSKYADAAERMGDTRFKAAFSHLTALYNLGYDIDFSAFFSN